MIESTITMLKMSRPPKRSVSMPNGIRPTLPSSTGMATAMLFCTGLRCICLLSSGIIADIVPNTAKQNAKAPVPSASCKGLAERSVAKVELRAAL